MWLSRGWRALIKGSFKDLILGKGAAYSRAEVELNELAVKMNIPVLPTPMGKGVIPDDSSLVVSAARSKVLGKYYQIIIVCHAVFCKTITFG